MYENHVYQKHFMDLNETNTNHYNTCLKFPSLFGLHWKIFYSWMVIHVFKLIKGFGHLNIWKKRKENHHLWFALKLIYAHFIYSYAAFWFICIFGDLMNKPRNSITFNQAKKNWRVTNSYNLPPPTPIPPSKSSPIWREALGSQTSLIDIFCKPLGWYIIYKLHWIFFKVNETFRCWVEKARISCLWGSSVDVQTFMKFHISSVKNY